MKKSIILCCCALILLTASACESGSSGSYIDKIKERGIVIAGLRVDTPSFGYLNSTTNEFEGIEIDLATLLTKRILGEEGKMLIKPVTAQTRTPMVQNESVDFTLATFTITEERKKDVDFSEPYCTDYITFMIRKDDNYKTIEDLAGKRIGVSKGISAVVELPKRAEEKGVDITIIEYPDNPSAVGALKSGDLEAFCTLRANLLGYVDSQTKLLEDYFFPSHLGVGVKKGNVELVDEINQFLAEITANGTLDELKFKWNL